MKIRLLWVSAAGPLNDNICCITPSSHTFFNRFLLDQLWKKSSNKGISYKNKTKEYHELWLAHNMYDFVPYSTSKSNRTIPAPLVSTYFSLGNRITGYNVTFPSWATHTGSAPCVITVILLRVPDAFGNWDILIAISSTLSVWSIEKEPRWVIK